MDEKYLRFTKRQHIAKGQHHARRYMVFLGTGQGQGLCFFEGVVQDIVIGLR